MSNFTNYKPNWAIHPGEIVLYFAEYRCWSNEELAKRSGLSEQAISKIVNGKGRITPEIAEKLAKVFGMKTSFFVNAQTLYDETLPKQITAEEIQKEQAVLKKPSYKPLAI